MAECKVKSFGYPCDRVKNCPVLRETRDPTVVEKEIDMGDVKITIAITVEESVTKCSGYKGGHTSG